MFAVTTFEGDYAIQRALTPRKVFSFESGNRHKLLRARVAVLQKRYRIYIFKGLRSGNRRFRSTTKMTKLLVFQ